MSEHIKEYVVILHPLSAYFGKRAEVERRDGCSVTVRVLGTSARTVLHQDEVQRAAD